jgi:hypothetical protein
MLLVYKKLCHAKIGMFDEEKKKNFGPINYPDEL